MSSSQVLLNVILFTAIFTIAGLWAIWHNTSGFALAYVLQKKSINLDNC